LRLAAHERRPLYRQIVTDGIEGAQRRKALPEARRDHLKDVLGVLEIAETMLSKIDKTEVVVERVAEERRGRR